MSESVAVCLAASGITTGKLPSSQIHGSTHFNINYLYICSSIQLFFRHREHIDIHWTPFLTEAVEEGIYFNHTFNNLISFSFSLSGPANERVNELVV